MCWGEKEMRICPHDRLIEEQPIRWIDCQHGSLTLGSCHDRFIHVVSVNRLCTACQAEIVSAQNNADARASPPHQPIKTPESEPGPAEDLPSYEDTMTDPAYDQFPTLTDSTHVFLGRIYDAITCMHEVLNADPTNPDPPRRLYTLVYIKSTLQKLRIYNLARIRRVNSLVKQRDEIEQQYRPDPSGMTQDDKARIIHINLELREIDARCIGYTDDTDFAGGGTVEQMSERLSRFIEHVVLDLKPVRAGQFIAESLEKTPDAVMDDASFDT